MVMLLPHTIAFKIGPVLFTSYRVVMIGLTVPILIRLATGRLRLGLPDALVAIFSAWSIMCILINYPDGQNAERAGQFFLEVTLAYYLSRAYISNIEQMYKLAACFFVITAVAGILALPEAITHKKPIIEITSQISGISTGFYFEGTDVRMGLRRAQAFFENPILYGLFCATSFSLIWYTETNALRRAMKLLIITFATFLSVSSAPLLGLMTQLVMICIEISTRNLHNRILIIGGGSAVIFIFLEIFTKSGPLGIIINHLTFNQASSYNRILIWDYGIQNIMKHPFIGIMTDNWERAAFMKVSIDNFYIYTGLISGFVGWGLIVGIIVSVVWRLNSVPLKLLTKRHVDFRRGWSLMMIAFAFTGFSVMFFGKLQPYFYFLLGLGAAAGAIYADYAKREQGAQRAYTRQKRSPSPATQPLLPA